MSPIDFNSRETNSIQVNGAHQLVIDILQNVFFYVPNKKELHTGSEQHWGE